MRVGWGDGVAEADDECSMAAGAVGREMTGCANDDAGYEDLEKSGHKGSAGCLKSCAGLGIRREVAGGNKKNVSDFLS